MIFCQFSGFCTEKINFRTPNAGNPPESYAMLSIKKLASTHPSGSVSTKKLSCAMFFTEAKGNFTWGLR